MTGFLYKKGERKTKNKTAAAGPDKIRLVKATIRLEIEYTTKGNVADDNTQMQTNPLFKIFSGSAFSSLHTAAVQRGLKIKHIIYREMIMTLI